MVKALPAVTSTRMAKPNLLGASLAKLPFSLMIQAICTSKGTISTSVNWLLLAVNSLH